MSHIALNTTEQTNQSRGIQQGRKPERVRVNLQEARTCLNLCQRNELRDHKKGTRRLSWFFNKLQVAEGFYGEIRHVTIYEYREFFESNKILEMFVAEDASKLQFCGDPVIILRADEGDPNEAYQGA